MSVLLGKIKQKKNYYKFLNTPNDLYNVNTDKTHRREYTPRASSDDDKWFVLNNFSQKTYCLDVFKNHNGTSVYSQIDSTILKDLSKLSYLCWIDDNENFYIQKITPSKCVVKARAINQTFSIVPIEPYIKIENIPDAIYVKNEDILLFKKVNTISSIFKGISEISQEATDEEIEDLSITKKINVGFTYTNEDFSSRMRRQVKKIDSFLDNLDSKQKEAFKKYMKQNCPSVSEVNGVYQCSDMESLKRFLDAIEENFITTPVTGKAIIVDSIIKPEDY